MKRIIFFLSMLWCSVSSYAQMTKEQAGSICAQEMALFTKAVSGVYEKGMTFTQFQSALCGNLQPAAEGANQLKAAYGFLVSGTTADAIVKTYAGKEIAASFSYLLNAHKRGLDSDGSELFGGKTGSANTGLAKNAEGGCKWYQVWCLMQSFATWLIMNWPGMQQLLDIIIGPLIY